MKLRKRLFVLSVVLMVSIFAVPQSYAMKYGGDLRNKRAAESADHDAAVRSSLDGGIEDTGKTFIAVTVPGVEISAQERVFIDKRVRGVFGGLFELGKALEVGPGTTSLQDQVKKKDLDPDLAKRVEAAISRLKDALSGEVMADGGSLRDEFESHRVVFFVDDEHPALYRKGGLDLIGSSGNFPWGDKGESPGSHYIKLALVESAEPALGRDGAFEFFRAWVRHEVTVLASGKYVEPTQEDNRILNEGYAKILRYLAEKTRENQLKQVTVDIVTVKIGPHLSSAGVPDKVVTAIRDVLASAKERGDIVAFKVLKTANALMLQLNHHQGADSPIVQQLASEAVSRGLEAAETMGILKSSSNALIGRDYFELATALRITRGSIPMTERGADPIIIANAINGGTGAFTRALFNIFFHPDRHPTQRLSAETFRAVVERVEDVRQGKKDRVRYVFSHREMPQLLALIGDHTEWMIAEVYAETGRFAKTNPGEPVAKVIVEPVSPEGFTDEASSSTLFLRLQSGSEAIGVATDALASPWVAPGGADDAYHLTTIPVSMEEAANRPGRGYMPVTAYLYMSYGNGKIGIKKPIAGEVPLEDQVIDLFNPVAGADFGLLHDLWEGRTPPLQVVFARAQEKAHELAIFMQSHGDMDPFLTARGAETLSGTTAASVAGLWVDIPRTELSVEQGGEVDEAVQKANAASKGRTLSVIKADAGGYGHLNTPEYFSVAAEASLAMMEARNLILSSEHLSVGDDYETISVHLRGADDHEIHSNAYQIFWRMVYLADNFELEKGPGGTKRVKAKPYGVGQDLVSEEARGKPVPQLAGINEEVVQEMVKYLRAAGRNNQAEALLKGWEIYKADIEGTVAVAITPFSGNITGQGPGFAELPLPAEGPVLVAFIASDKTGPAAFNIPILWALEQAVSRGTIKNKGGAIAVIDDTKGHKRISLDVETQMDIIRGLASNPDRYNFKRVTSKSGDRFFIATSTEKLSIITGGEYRGKDDSVLLADNDLGELLFEHARDHVYLTQGDGFGSHYCHPRPERLATAIATKQSRGIQVGFWVDVSADNQLHFTEVYDDPSYDMARDRSEALTEAIWGTQGSEFTPVGVGTDRTEKSYPLAKTVRAITDPDSRFAVPTRVDAGESVAQAIWAGQFNATGYQSTPRAASAAHYTLNPKAILIHGNFFRYGPDGAIAIQRYLDQLAFDGIDEAVKTGAVKLVVDAPFEGQDEADKWFSNLIAAVNEASKGATSLRPGWFIVRSKGAEIEAPPIVAAIGPREWLNDAVVNTAMVKVVFGAPTEPGKIISAASAFFAAIEAIATDNNQLPPPIAKKLDVSLDPSGFIVPSTQTVSSTIEKDIRAYQQVSGRL